MAHALINDPRARLDNVVILTDEHRWRGSSDAIQVGRVIDLGGILISHNQKDRPGFVGTSRPSVRPDDPHPTRSWTQRL